MDHSDCAFLVRNGHINPEKTERWNSRERVTQLIGPDMKWQVYAIESELFVRGVVHHR